MEKIASAIFRRIEEALAQESVSFFEMETESLVKNYQRIEAEILELINKKEQKNYNLYLNIFIEQLRYVPKQAIDKTLKDSRFYNAWCGFYLKLFNLHSELKIKLQNYILSEYFRNHYLIWQELIEWLSINNINNKMDNRQKDCIKYFISSLELWIRYIKPSQIEMQQQHLEYTPRE